MMCLIISQSHQGIWNLLSYRLNGTDNTSLVGPRPANGERASVLTKMGFLAHPSLLRHGCLGSFRPLECSLRPL
jgi:hypothetical protein